MKANELEAAAFKTCNSRKGAVFRWDSAKGTKRSDFCIDIWSLSATRPESKTCFRS